MVFPDHDYPCLIAGNFNIDNPLSDPRPNFSPNDIAVSTPYYEHAVDMGFSLLNTPRVYT